jgi:transcriptional regulator with XRE-family HTH domain
MATAKFSRDVAASALCARVGRKIRGLREKRGWTQQILADHAQIERSHLARVEEGIREPGIMILERIADALEVPVWELLKA